MALTGGLGANSLSGFGAGDSVVESIASSYTLSDTSLTGSGASFSDNLSGIQVAILTGICLHGQRLDRVRLAGRPIGHRHGDGEQERQLHLDQHLAFVTSDGMSLSLSGINIADLDRVRPRRAARPPSSMPAPSPAWPISQRPEPARRSCTVVSGGHDTLTAAGSGNDILIGNGASDTLTDAGSGRNILIGAGAGGDTLTGDGNDILVSGTTELRQRHERQYRGPGRHPGRVDLEGFLREPDQDAQEGRGQEAYLRFELTHNPDGYERQYARRSELSKPEK